MDYHHSHEQHRREELLELLWIMWEEDDRRRSEVLRRSNDPETDRLLGNLEQEGLVLSTGDTLILTAEGRVSASEVIRRHRLAERLLVDLFDVGDEQVMEKGACQFEHVLSEDVIEKVCSFLGHPPLCPHGKTIPAGACCAAYEPRIRPLILRLSDMELGSWGKITFMGSRTRSRLDRLEALGINPGSTIRLKQRRPAFVVEVDETVVAIDPGIAEEIFVRPSPEESREGRAASGNHPVRRAASDPETKGRRGRARRLLGLFRR